MEEIEKLVYQFKEEQLPEADTPFHYQAEIWSGVKDFLEWLKHRN